MKKLRIKSSLAPAIVYGKKSSTIVAGTIYELNGKPWNNIFVRCDGHITHDDIEWLSGITVDTKDAPKEWQVPSSNGIKFYTVREVNGKKTCDCDGFSYRRTCRHIDIANETN